METAAAPAPEMTIFTCSFSFPTTFRALVSPASVIMAVPCWSSWKMGISHRSFNLRSISKHRGAAISSKLIPPKLPEILYTVSTKASTSWVLMHRGKVHTAKSFKQHAFPFHHRHSRLWPNIPQAEDRATIRYDSAQIMPAGKGIAFFWKSLYFQTGFGHARGIGQG